MWVVQRSMSHPGHKGEKKKKRFPVRFDTQGSTGVNDTIPKAWIQATGQNEMFDKEKRIGASVEIGADQSEHCVN